jgi:hypothetical protein
MPIQKLFSKILSFAISALFLGLFIYFLPSILVIFGVIVLLLIIAGIVLRFVIKKNMLKMNFIYTTQNSESGEEEISEMKDVTNSSKNQSNKAPLT